jgi:hypothetical protein
MFNTIKTYTGVPVAYARLALEIRAANKQYDREVAEEKAYNDRIAASQAKLAETTLVPGFVNVYA